MRGMTERAVAWMRGGFAWEWREARRRSITGFHFVRDPKKTRDRDETIGRCSHSPSSRAPKEFARGDSEHKSQSTSRPLVDFPNRELPTLLSPYYARLPNRVESSHRVWRWWRRCRFAEAWRWILMLNLHSAISARKTRRDKRNRVFRSNLIEIVPKSTLPRQNPPALQKQYTSA